MRRGRELTFYSVLLKLDILQNIQNILPPFRQGISHEYFTGQSLNEH